MTGSRIYPAPNFLAAALSKDGPSAGSLLSDANARVAALAADIALFVADRVALLAAWTDQPEDVLFSGRQSVAGAAAAIVEVAEAAGMEAVGSVARGICVLLDGAANADGWHADALRVHLRALVLVHSQSREPESDWRRITAELRSLRESLGLTE